MPPTATPPKMVPILGGDSAQELRRGWEILVKAGIPNNFFGSRGWYVVVLEVDLARGRELLKRDESVRKVMMTDEQIKSYRKHFREG